MAFEEDVLDVAFEAAGDISAYKYHFVKLSADNTVTVCSHATNDNPIGILQNAPNAAGQVARVRLYGVSRVMTGSAGITLGSYVGTDASGHGIDKATDKYKYLGIATEASASGETGTVVLFGPKTISMT